jgi:uridine kinase
VAIWLKAARRAQLLRRCRKNNDWTMLFYVILAPERGRTNDGVIKQYLASVKPMHDLHVAPTKHLADLVVQWDNYNDRTIEMLTKMVFSITAARG